MQQLATITPGTHPAVRDRIPEIIALIHEDYTIQEIADKLDIHRSTVWRSLQRVDFNPIVSVLLNDILCEIGLIEDADKRVWSRIQLVKALYSKKVKAEVTTRIHQLTEERQTFRVEFEALSPEDQQTWIRLNEKMGRRLVESEQADP